MDGYWPSMRERFWIGWRLRTVCGKTFFWWTSINERLWKDVKRWTSLERRQKMNVFELLWMVVFCWISMNELLRMDVSIDELLWVDVCEWTYFVGPLWMDVYKGNLWMDVYKGSLWMDVYRRSLWMDVDRWTSKENIFFQ